MGLFSFAISLLAAGAASASAAATSSPSADAVVVSDKAVTRSIDCGGRDLSVVGSDDVLTVAGCNVINVLGNRNRIRVKLLPTSAIAALGADNHIVFQHAPGFEAVATSSGAGNEIVPQMSAKDSAPTPLPAILRHPR